MKSPKTMTYKDLEREVIENRVEMQKASIERKRELINRSHDLMTEMDRRWNAKKSKEA